MTCPRHTPWFHLCEVRGASTLSKGTVGSGRGQMWKLLERKGRASLAGEVVHIPWSRAWPPPEMSGQR